MVDLVRIEIENEYARGSRDFSNIDLDLRGANLSRLNLEGVNLEETNLSGANLKRANLSGANLSGANLSGANLSGANLEWANLEWANLQGAKLKNAIANEETIFPQNFSPLAAGVRDITEHSQREDINSKVTLKLPEINNLELPNINQEQPPSLNKSVTEIVTEITTKEETQKMVDLVRNEIEEQYARGLRDFSNIDPDMRGANFSFANLSMVNLESANLESANLRWADLSLANLSLANLSLANLESANLRWANLSLANLKSANLSGAKLQSAKLQRANLEGANLEGANLERANLKKANLEGANLKNAIANKETIFPQNFDPLAAGVRDITKNSQTEEINSEVTPKLPEINNPELPNINEEQPPSLNKSVTEIVTEITTKEETQTIPQVIQQPINPKVDKLAQAYKYLESKEYFTPKSLKKAQALIKISIARRQGQSQFRQYLLIAYNHHCAITGCDAVEALEAAHIIPYIETENNHPSNGLLLRADIHTLFDLNLITINPATMTVQIAPSLGQSYYKEFHGKSLQLPINKDYWPKVEYLKWRCKQCEWYCKSQ